MTPKNVGIEGVRPANCQQRTVLVNTNNRTPSEIKINYF